MTAILPASDIFWIVMLTVVPLGLMLLLGRRKNRGVKGHK